MDEDKLPNKETKLLQNDDVLFFKLAEFGIKLPSHLSNRLPNEFTVIDCIETKFFEAIKYLKRQDVLGVSLEGSNIGRSGTLDWFNISSSTCTYLFNIKSIGKDAFENGLKLLLENKRIIKVFHDCRKAADSFYHQYNTKLVNVYDTQVADFVAYAMKTNANQITNKVNSLNYCLELYLNVPSIHANVALKPCSINHELLCYLINNVIYLRVLKQELDMILRMPFRRCVDVCLNTILRKQDQELQLYPPDLKRIPPELVMDNMQLFKFDEKLKPKDLSKLKVDDPYRRYERDCKKYQQEYGYGKFANNKGQDAELSYENLDGGYSYSNRQEIIQFLLDRMFAGDECDRSVISMTPFKTSSEYDDCSVASKQDICMETVKKQLGKSETRNIPKSDYISEHSLENKNKMSSKSLHKRIDQSLAFPDISLNSNEQAESCKTAESKSSESSSSKKSQIYKILSDQKHLLQRKNQFSNDSTIRDNEDTNIVTEAVLDSSSSSSLSGKSEIYKLLFEKKNLLTSQEEMLNHNTVKKISLEEENFSTERKIEGSNPPLSKKSEIYKLFAEHKRSRGGQSSDSSTLNTFSKETSSDSNSVQQEHKNDGNFNAEQEKLSNDTSFESKFFYEYDSKDYDGFRESANSDDFEKDASNFVVTQDEDPWTKLRDAFSELGPAKYGSEKVVFIPAGMQY